jgi:5-methylcytosine-specific restriction enzyme subunit McrC
MLFTEQVRHNHSRADRCYIRYTEFNRDIPVNRLLLAALNTARLASLHAPLQARVISLLHCFEGVGRVMPRSSDFERVVMTRATQRYGEGLTLARMIIENLSPAFQSGKDPVFSMLFDMNKLWESYIGVLFQRANVPGVRAARQCSTRFWDPSDAKARTLRPDIVLQDARSKKTLAVLDTKWKIATGGPSADDLQQMFAYNEMFSSDASFLIYPSCRALSGPALSGHFVDRSHRCSTLELGLDHQGQHTPSSVLQRIRDLVRSLAQPSPPSTGLIHENLTAIPG